MATITQPREFIMPDSWPKSETMNPSVSAMNSDRVMLLNWPGSAKRLSQQIRPIPVRHAPKSCPINAPAGSSVAPRMDIANAGARTKAIPKPVEDTGVKNHQPFFLFEPSLDHLVRELIPEALKIQIYKAFLDSQAAEHGARMTAMHQATDNATEMLRNLTLEYNKARQAAITGELIEIVSGAEALKS